MRILHLIPSLSGGGAEQQLVYLANGLADRGHDVSVGFLRNGPAECNLARSVHLQQLRAYNSYDPRILSQLVRLMRTLTPHVVQSWMLQMDVFGGGACAITSTPWIVREPSTRVAYPTSWKSILRQRMCRRASAIVSNSKGGDRYWQQSCPNIARFMIRNGLPLDDIAAVPPARREDLALPPDGPLLVYAGRLTHGKNLELLIQALARVVSDCDGATIVFCGAGVLRERIEAITEHLLGNRARFLGFIEATRLWSILKIADGFLFPSEFEGMPNVVAEAMACECPVMLSNIAAHREIANCESAIFVDPHDVESIAGGITRLLSLSNDARVKAAFRTVETWSVSAMVDQYEAVYEEVQS